MGPAKKDTAHQTSVSMDKMEIGKLSRIQQVEEVLDYTSNIIGKVIKIKFKEVFHNLSIDKNQGYHLNNTLKAKANVIQHTSEETVQPGDL